MSFISLKKSLSARLGGAVLVLLIACSFVSAQEPKLTGTWVYTDTSIRLTLKLNEDGSATLQGKAFSYTARGNRLVMVDDKGAVSSYSYELRNDVLTIGGATLQQPLDFKRVVSLDGATRSGDHSGSTATSREPLPRKDATEEEDTGLVGKWQASDYALQIFKDGKLTINGDQFSYRVDGRHVILSNSEGSVRVEFELNGDTLTTNYQGLRTVYRRVRGGASAAAEGMSESGGANPAELAGKWCYMSNVTANDGGRISSTCFTLYPNGTYEYYSETNSSNPYGGTASQSSDSGTWSVSGGTLIANSRSRGRQVYTLEKRNHPKTGDPMLMVDGDAFVTYTQRRPW